MTAEGPQATKQKYHTQTTQGEAMFVKADWLKVRRGRKRYFYPRIVLPSRAVAELGIEPDDNIEFEVHVELRDGEKILVLKPRRRTIA